MIYSRELGRIEREASATIGTMRSQLETAQADLSLLRTRVAELTAELERIEADDERARVQAALQAAADGVAYWQLEAERLGRSTAAAGVTINGALQRAALHAISGSSSLAHLGLPEQPAVHPEQMVERGLEEGASELAARFDGVQDALEHASDRLRRTTDELGRVVGAAAEQRDALVNAALTSLFSLRRHLSNLHAFAFDNALDESSSYARATHAGLLLHRTMHGVEASGELMITGMATGVSPAQTLSRLAPEKPSTSAHASAHTPIHAQRPAPLIDPRLAERAVVNANAPHSAQIALTRPRSTDSPTAETRLAMAIKGSRAPSMVRPSSARAGARSTGANGLLAPPHPLRGRDHAREQPRTRRRSRSLDVTVGGVPSTP
jgi:hypothetical protein